MQRIFISDLDGTLLQPDHTLSDYARRQLEAMLASGLPFTIATARSVITVKEILGDLPLQLPIVCGNGAYLTDLHAGTHYQTLGIPANRGKVIYEEIMRRHLPSFICTVAGPTERMYLNPRQSNPALNAYHLEREQARDRRLYLTDDLAQGLEDEVICFNVLDQEAPLRALAADLEGAFPGQLAVYWYENWFDQGWYWLSIYDHRATKAGGIQELLRQTEFEAEHLTVFGDSYNDLSMFALARQSIAPENAKAAVKAQATQIIGTNEADSVVNYLLQATQK